MKLKLCEKLDSVTMSHKKKVHIPSHLLLYLARISLRV